MSRITANLLPTITTAIIVAIGIVVTIVVVAIVVFIIMVLVALGATIDVIIVISTIIVIIFIVIFALVVAIVVFLQKTLRQVTLLAANSGGCNHEVQSSTITENSYGHRRNEELFEVALRSLSSDSRRDRRTYFAWRTSVWPKHGRLQRFVWRPAKSPGQRQNMPVSPQEIRASG